MSTQPMGASARRTAGGPHAWARQNHELADDAQTAYIGGGYTADGTTATIQIS